MPCHRCQVAPSNLRTTTVTATSVTLAWNDNAANETGFQLERSNNNKTFALIATPGANVLEFTDTNVTANKTYYYRLRAFNAGGNSAYSNTLTVKTPRR
jgi:hypothetical protein